MKHQLTNNEISMCNKIRKNVEDNKKNKNQSFLVLEEKKLNMIFKAELTPTSKMLLIHLLSKVHFSYEHLYVYLPYSQLASDTGIKKSTAVNSLKDLEKEGFIKLYSGTNRIKNNNIKEFIFQQEQKYNPVRNQQNIIDMYPFFDKLLK